MNSPQAVEKILASGLLLPIIFKPNYFKELIAMNPNEVSQALQKGLHLTLGAATSLVEALQFPEESKQKFAEVDNDLGRLADILETKGQATEKEARQLVDILLSQLPHPFASGDSSSPASTVETVAQPVTDNNLQKDLIALTEELTAIRRDLQILKEGSGNS
ncbi:MAG: hypothetical protein LVS60_05085 [Nodosilinea sp. LVE1205-7]|jgi:polyhydroxyalkanoate synthesis regulator phasin